MIIVRHDVKEKVKLKSKNYFQLIILSIKYQINVNEAHHSFPESKLLQTVQKLFNYGDK